MSQSEMRRPKVLILCLQDDRKTAESIATYLEGKDMSVSLRDPETAARDHSSTAPGKESWTAVVVLLSESAVKSDKFIPAAARVSNERIVPVCTTPVDAESIPAFLSELNWVLWYEPSAVDKLLSIFVGVNTDLGRYRETKSVEQEARAWQAAGRDNDYLIMDAARVEALRVNTWANPSTELRSIRNSRWTSCDSQTKSAAAPDGAVIPVGRSGLG